MRMRWIRRVAWVPLLMAGAVSLPAQTIDGRVLEERTSAAVDSAMIQMLNQEGMTAATAVTDTLGRFHLSAAEGGSYRLRLERPGFRTAITPMVELRDSDTVELVVHMSTDTIALAPITVTAHSGRPPGYLRGFYRRRQRGSGYFITRDRIERDRPVQISDELMRIPGLWLTPSRFGIGYDVQTPTGCSPTIVVDGLRYPLLGESIDDIVNPMDVEGIEVYSSSAEVPVEYAGWGSACGAILIWTG